MRLLERKLDSRLVLSEYIGKATHIPAYAILSHTWAANNTEEVILQDIEDGTFETKPGYNKIRFCAEKAAADGLRYFWIDTCCIDKKNAVELAEAINSMFRWYQQATRCYVYLSDVSIACSNEDPSQSSKLMSETAFRASRWFTRGWTLQELLAPMKVEFFSKEGERIGDKKSLERYICEITAIPPEALQGRPLSAFSTDERLSWQASRETTREEDEAYSLLGIFNIYMPLLYGEGRKNAFVRLQRHIDESSAEVPETLSMPSSTVPFRRDPDFVDRSNILTEIIQRCSQPGGRVALVGLGGVGKSQLAIEYSYRAREQSPHKWVFWVHASNAARFEAGYKNIADTLRLPKQDDTTVNVMRRVCRWLRSEASGQWLLILDNADDESFFSARTYEAQGAVSDDAHDRLTLADLLPQSQNGSLLITSRNMDVATKLTGGYKDIIQIQPMSPDEGLALLRHKLIRPLDGQESELVAALEYMPLAIIQAAAYINKRWPRITVTGYTQALRTNDNSRVKLLNQAATDLRRDEEASNSILATWQISFDNLREERQSAADLLSFMSFFNPQGIPDFLLRNYLEHESDGGKEDIEDRFEDDLHLLRSYSLLGTNPEGDVFEMHRLVQFATRVWLRSFSGEDRWRKRFLMTLSKEFPNDDFENWSKCRLLLPHVEPLLGEEPMDITEAKCWAQVLHNAASYTCTQGLYAQAERMAQYSTSARTRILGVENVDTLASIHNLAGVFLAQGKYTQAEQLQRRALEGREKVLGEDHPDTLESVGQLAHVLLCRGKYTDTEQLQRRALEDRRRVLGEEHSDTLESINQLAVVLGYLGKYAEAEQLNRRALEGREKALGEEHPATFESAHELAVMLERRGKYDKAERLHRWVLHGRGKVLGEDHPQTLDTIYELAVVLGDKGRYNEAEQLHRRALEGYEKALGEAHPATLVSVSQLAGTLLGQGKYDDAERLLRRAIEGKVKVLGEDHPDTFTSIHELAYLYGKQKQYDAASELFQKAYDGYERVLGKDHPHTMICRDNMARMLK